jgi:hypothetical protein
VIRLWIVCAFRLLILNICASVTGEAMALAFQHYILSLGTAVMIPTMLVPMMGGNDVRIPSFLIYLYTSAC